ISHGYFDSPIWGSKIYKENFHTCGERIAIAEKYRPIIEKKAKENKIKSAEMTNEKLGNTVCQNSDKR
ncbi:hypothetical protein, partial [Clostridium tertium]|uniref:hypothetical protein n=1 Tax=Clostridium tertium TaxID=1559 RepID=UPI00255D989F|nr:hypothetical protein [Clostridium tertium]